MEETGTFRSERLPLAIAIHASERLPFLRCERAGPNRVEFVFLDAEGRGAELELLYDSGALVLPAVRIFASQKFLRRQMSDVLENRRMRTLVYTPR